MKILGVVLDRRLTYKDQITEQIKKASAKASTTQIHTARHYDSPLQGLHSAPSGVSVDPC